MATTPISTPINVTNTTVRRYIAGEHEGQNVYLHTFERDELVTGYELFSDGPWVQTGTGITQRSWCVCQDTILTVR